MVGVPAYVATGTLLQVDCAGISGETQLLNSLPGDADDARAAGANADDFGALGSVALAEIVKHGVRIAAGPSTDIYTKR
jgi:hypothetical protein